MQTRLDEPPTYAHIMESLKKGQLERLHDIKVLDPRFLEVAADARESAVHPSQGRF